MTGATLDIVRAGPGTSVQDRGREGHRRYGVPVSGPVDWAAHATALSLAGCEQDDAAIEFGPGGLSVEAEGGRIALGVAGGLAAGRWTHAGGRAVLPAPFALTLSPGEQLSLRPGPCGWGALAARGLDVGPPVLGSFATAVRAGLGPPVPESGSRYSCTPAEATPFTPARDPLADEAEPILRVLAGPQTHLFEPSTRRRLIAESYEVTRQRDRMGIRLDGPPLIAPGGHDIVSDGLVEGAMQVPGDGNPIVLMADRSPTGGYPKIAVLARADLPVLARLSPGRTVRFRWIEAAEAREATAALTEACRTPVPRRRAALDPAWLRAHGRWR